MLAEISSHFIFSPAISATDMSQVGVAPDIVVKFDIYSLLLILSLSLVVCIAREVLNVYELIFISNVTK